jgi:hypothetical protein
VNVAPWQPFDDAFDIVTALFRVWVVVPLAAISIVRPVLSTKATPVVVQPAACALSGVAAPVPVTEVGLAVFVIVVFAVAGEQILSYLGIDLPALQGAGGLLLLLVALDLLTGRTDDPQRQVTSNVALVPLGTPLLAGPGAIVATMLFMRNATDTRDYIAIGAGVGLVFVVTLLMVRFSGATLLAES